MTTIRKGKAEMEKLLPLLKSCSISFLLTMRSRLLKVGEAMPAIYILIMCSYS